MSETLKPCPFCGGEARLIRSAPDWYFPACMNRECACDWTDSYPTKAEAIAAWNTRATHGTLTAEQVRECVKSVYFEGYNDGSVNRGQHLEETDWQAIADELNARAERTCRIVEYADAPIPVCSECGAVQSDDYAVYYCWSCGARVRDE